MLRWSGRVAVVTGASSGIGANITERLALEGLQVVGFDLNEKGIEEIAKKLPKNCKGKVIAYKCDVTEEKQVKDAFEWVDKNVGGISIMINNAGLVKFVSFTGKCFVPFLLNFHCSPIYSIIKTDSDLLL